MTKTAVLNAPMIDVPEALLSIRHGLQHATITAEPNQSQLLHATFARRIPDVEVHRGDVTLSYPRFALSRGHRDLLHLNPKLPWAIHVRGAVADVAADLTGLSLVALSVDGALSQVAIDLPHPSRTIHLRLGTVSNVAILRPAGVAVRIAHSGGVRDVTLDEQHLGSAAGPGRLITPDYDQAVDRFDIHVDKASRLIVSTL